MHRIARSYATCVGAFCVFLRSAADHIVPSLASILPKMASAQGGLLCYLLATVSTLCNIPDPRRPSKVVKFHVLVGSITSLRTFQKPSLRIKEDLKYINRNLKDVSIDMPRKSYHTLICDQNIPSGMKGLFEHVGDMVMEPASTIFPDARL